ncbi:hypothetical protein [Paenibacillus senegalimassiliensis]|uniref:hypothetical protein n=1 Tax=Paenibacillus senegalimassiliensis TaxID=1737426 RepID=UPI00073F8A97|nr:hypothetical protein [Paenibacillus senegalimassiliensis]
MDTEITIKHEILGLLKTHTEASRFIELLSQIGELLFFGGSIRDYYINQKYETLPRDFDIAIKFDSNNSKESNSTLQYILKNYNYKKNRFGGYKVQVEHIEFDIWDMKNTWAFKEEKLVPKEENLVKTVYLNIDGIVYNFNKNILYYDEINKSLEDKLIDIVLDDNPQKKLNLLRAIVFKKKYNLQFSSDLIDEFKKNIKSKSDFSNELYLLQFTHYKEERLNIEEIRRELSTMTW